jgi:hypothetical protein
MLVMFYKYLVATRPEYKRKLKINRFITQRNKESAFVVLPPSPVTVAKSADTKGTERHGEFLCGAEDKKTAAFRHGLITSTILFLFTVAGSM